MECCIFFLFIFIYFSTHRDSTLDAPQVNDIAPAKKKRNAQNRATVNEDEEAKEDEEDEENEEVEVGGAQSDRPGANRAKNSKRQQPITGSATTSVLTRMVQKIQKNHEELQVIKKGVADIQKDRERSIITRFKM